MTCVAREWNTGASDLFFNKQKQFILEIINSKACTHMSPSLIIYQTLILSAMFNVHLQMVLSVWLTPSPPGTLSPSVSITSSSQSTGLATKSPNSDHNSFTQFGQCIYLLYCWKAVQGNIEEFIEKKNNEKVRKSWFSFWWRRNGNKQNNNSYNYNHLFTAPS